MKCLHQSPPFKAAPFVTYIAFGCVSIREIYQAVLQQRNNINLTQTKETKAGYAPINLSKTLALALSLYKAGVRQV